MTSCKIDLQSAHHQVRVKRDDIPKTTFNTRYGHYKFLIMSFGLANAAAVFMDMINRIIDDYLDQFSIVFVDNILIYSKKSKGPRTTDHVVHLQKASEGLGRIQ